MNKTLPKGHESCLNTEFKYVPAIHTDLAKTFARVRQQQPKDAQQAQEPDNNVHALPVRKSG